MHLKNNTPVKQIDSEQFCGYDDDRDDSKVDVGRSELKCSGGEDQRVGGAGDGEPLEAAVESPQHHSPRPEQVGEGGRARLVQVPLLLLSACHIRQLLAIHPGHFLNIGQGLVVSS